MGRLVSFGDDGRRVTVHALLPHGTLRPVMERIGELLVYAARRAIHEQRRGSATWPPRKVPNVLGVLEDLAAGRSVASYRLTPRPALVATGRLERSFRYRLIGRRTVVTTSSAPYARQAEEGGTKTVALTRAIKSRLRGWIPSQPEEIRRRFRGFSKKSSVTVTWPARPLTGLPPDLRPKVVGLLRSKARRLSLGMRG